MIADVRCLQWVKKVFGDVFMKTNDVLAKSVSINSSLRAKVIYTVAISSNELYNNNTRNIKISDRKNSIWNMDRKTFWKNVLTLQFSMRRAKQTFLKIKDRVEFMKYKNKNFSVWRNRQFVHQYWKKFSIFVINSDTEYYSVNSNGFSIKQSSKITCFHGTFIILIL